jgi:hypothetical protein
VHDLLDGLKDPELDIAFNSMPMATFTSLIFLSSCVTIMTGSPEGIMP